MKNLFQITIKKSGFLGLFVLAILAGCSDSTTATNSETQNEFYSFEDLPNCTKRRVGEIAYIKDADSAYICSNGRWEEYVPVDTVATEDDLLTCSKGNEGKTAFIKSEKAVFTCSKGSWEKVVNSSQDAGNYEPLGCTVEALDDLSGYRILCNGDSVGVIRNGDDGEKGDPGEQGIQGEMGDPGKQGDKGDKGDDGKNGTSCTMEPKADSSGYNVRCGDKIVGTISNGKKGDTGDPGEQGDQGEKGDDGEPCSVSQMNGMIYLTCDGKTVTIPMGQASSSSSINPPVSSSNLSSSSSKPSPSSSSSIVIPPLSSSGNPLPTSMYGTCSISISTDGYGIGYGTPGDAYIGDKVTYTFVRNTNNFSLLDYMDAEFEWNAPGGSIQISNDKGSITVTYTPKGTYSTALVINGDMDNIVYCQPVEVVGYRASCNCSGSTSGAVYQESYLSGSMIDVSNGPVLVAYNASCTSQGGSVVDYSWNGGSYVSSNTFTHDVNVGTFTPSLKVRDVQGTETSFSSCPSYAGFVWSETRSSIQSGQRKYLQAGKAYYLEYSCNWIEIKPFNRKNANKTLYGTFTNDGGTSTFSGEYYQSFPPSGYGSGSNQEIIITLESTSSDAELNCQ